MRKVLLIAIGLCGLWLGGTTPGQPPEPPPVPDRVASRFAPEDPPLWLSARAAARLNGEIDWSQFRSWSRDSLQKWLESESYRKQGCLGPYEVYVTLGDRPRIESFPELVVDSKAIYDGRVARAAGGFFSGRPGTLVQVSIERVLKAGEDFNVEKHVYVFLPQGNFRVGRYSFCIQHSSYPDVPARGARILVLPSLPPEDAERKIFYPYLGEVFVETSDGGLGVPAIWKNEVQGRGLKTWNELMASVESLLGQQGEVLEQ